MPNSKMIVEVNIHLILKVVIPNFNQVIKEEAEEY